MVFPNVCPNKFQSMILAICSLVAVVITLVISQGSYPTSSCVVPLASIVPVWAAWGCQS